MSEKTNTVVMGVTGHRFLNHSPKEVSSKLSELWLPRRDEILAVATGMAIGFDQLVATWCVENKVPFVGMVPFVGQETRWPKRNQEEYKWLLSKAAKVVIVTELKEGETGKPYMMFKRNEAIVNCSHEMFAYLNPKETKGGTFHCVEFAKKKNKPPTNIYPMLNGLTS